MKKYYILITTLFFTALVSAHPEKRAIFHSKITPIPLDVQKKMRQYTWHEGCPLALDQLAYMQLSYWGFDHKAHLGTLIVHKELAHEVAGLFKVLYQGHYPIERMELMDAFQGDDNKAMAANNTSSFNCREVTDRPGEFSQHSYGRAIDINTLINPYVHGTKISPAQGAAYADRTKAAPGKIIKGDFVYEAFSKKGWDWAGNWFDVQDYQHFEKRAHGEKRNPYGYGPSHTK